MSKIAAYTSLQDQLGKDQARVIAEFLEEARNEDISEIVTKSVLRLELGEVRQEFRQELHDLENRINSRMQWTAVIQILTTVGAIVALAKLV